MNRFHTNKVAWRDLWAFLIYFLASNIIPIFIFWVLELKPNQISSPLFLTGVGILSSLLVILYLAWSHRHQLRNQMKNHFVHLKHSIKLILVAYIVYMIANIITNILMGFLPQKWQYTDTGNQEALKVLFEDPKILPLVFISIAILTPITEELLFRHIVIGELGKKFGFITMGLISIVFFAAMHLFAAVSPFEAIPYLLMATMFVVVYIKSGGNILASIASHMLVNSLAFFAIVAQMYS
ncbi:CPBP family intramembrane glutamic endopeptidase [Staphylococcus canis]|uniref:CPBP family intramembrane metalloprotease n=1 Tax=Staphylococcus canis TaxID=2724942 RepID=A0ABS0T5I4_9STAP|nr:CPBP family intramembrane glutamic endopeptidase [Staphylococcus canis]MBI5974011.1 CPBP family intramembrane metalloprotease [Staphylococcus canis]